MAMKITLIALSIQTWGITWARAAPSFMIARAAVIMWVSGEISDSFCTQIFAPKTCDTSVSPPRR